MAPHGDIETTKRPMNVAIPTVIALLAGLYLGHRFGVRHGVVVTLLALTDEDDEAETPTPPFVQAQRDRAPWQ